MPSSFSYPAGAVISAPGTATATVEVNQWWVIDPLAELVSIDPAVTAYQPVNTEQSAVHIALGSSKPAIIADTIGGDDGTITFETFDSPTFAALKALLRSQRTLWLINPYGEGNYVRFGPKSGGMSSGYGVPVLTGTLTPSSASGAHWIVAATFVAQDTP